jgi:V/A-type H+-transporting ATPase subunit E
MSVEAIIDRIMEDAKREAEDIAEQARRQAEAIQKENNKDAQEYYEEKKRLLDERYRKEMERAILNRRLEQRKAVLADRQSWMNRAFERARESLVDQPMEEYQRLMKTLVSNVTSSRDEEIAFGTKGKDNELKAIVDALNREKGTHFSLSKKRGEFAWGFILRKGKVETNMSIESLFKYKRNDLEQKAWELFNADA